MPSVNWSTEWLKSLLWVFGVWALVVIGFVLVGWFLIRPYALGPTVLAAVGYVLHPAASGLARRGGRS